MRAFYHIAISAFLGLLLLQSVRAQGICVTDERKLPVVKGVVTLTNDVPIPDATIVLHEKDFSGKVVAEARTDSLGHFEIPDIKAGRYALVAKSGAGFPRSIPVIVTSKKPARNRRVELVIKLGGMFGEPCGGGKVELRECKIT